MSGLVDSIFGSKSKESSSSSSSSSSHSGNYAYPFLASSLAPTTQYLQKGGDMLGALLGVNNVYPTSQPQPTTAAPIVANPVAPTPTGGYDYSSLVPQNSPFTYTGGQEDFYDLGNIGNADGGELARRRLLDLTNVNNGGADPSIITGVPSQPVTTPAPNPAPAPAPASGGMSQGDALNAWADSAGMNFLREQGIKAIEGSQAAKGLLQSGSTGKALEKFGQGLAQTYLNQYMDQLLNYSKLGAQGAGILTDAGNYSDGMTSASGTSKGSGGKQGLLQTILGNPANAIKF